MHLSKEVIRQSSIIVKSTKIGAADVAYLQLLVTRRPRCVLKQLQITLCILLLLLRGPNLMHLAQCHRDRSRLSEDRHFKETCVDCAVEICYLLELLK